MNIIYCLREYEREREYVRVCYVCVREKDMTRSIYIRTMTSFSRIPNEAAAIVAISQIKL